MKEILFVCTGNTCRSPMAEALMNRALHNAEKDGEYRARSAGLFAEEGGANPNAIAVMRERGLDISAHRARRLTVQALQNAWRVYTMSQEAAERLKASLPDQAQKIFPLCDHPIPDPYGGDEAVYRVCADALEERIDDLIKDPTLWN